MKRLVFLALLLATSAFGGERPPHMMIEESYFACPSSRSLQGGIFGKGPLRKFGPQPGSCEKREWERVSRERFKELATQWYAVDWSQDIPFFSDNHALAK